MSLISLETIYFGYIGLLFFRLFTGKYGTGGHDIGEKGVSSIQKGIDIKTSNNALNFRRDLRATQLTPDIKNITSCNIYIIAVPTLADNNHHPDMHVLSRACEDVCKVLSYGNIVNLTTLV